MLLGSKVASLAAYFDARTLAISITILSLIFIYIVILEHQELMVTMDTMVATTVGVSFLAPQPQNATRTSPSVLPGLSSDPSSTTTSANSWSQDSGYDWQRSTEENYRSNYISNASSDGFFGEFQEFRRRLDKSYHQNYIPSRQALQDTIIRTLLSSYNHCQDSSPISADDEKKCLRDEGESPPEQIIDPPLATREQRRDKARWIVFTAGVYGAGKSHTIGKLQDLGCFPPRSSFVGVDPDEIRRMLPEFSLYRADQVGALTQKEAGMIAELLTDIALSSGKNVVVDGSLRDASWHEGYFRSLRARFGNEAAERKTKNYNNIRIGILYVTAPIDEIYLRVEQRGASTGRSVPPEYLERSLKEVPEAIERLRPQADFYLHVHNSQTKQEDEESKAESEQESIASFVDGMEKEDTDLPAPSTKRKEDMVVKSEIEATIFQEKCRSIVGY